MSGGKESGGKMATKTAAKKTAAKKGSLVIVESPAKARTKEKYLGSGYSVMASLSPGPGATWTGTSSPST